MFWWHKLLNSCHDNVIKWKHFPHYLPCVRGIHRSSVNSPHKGQWRGALMFSLICAWINSWVNNGEASYLRRHRTQYDVIVMYVIKDICITAKLYFSWLTACLPICTQKKTHMHTGWLFCMTSFEWLHQTALPNGYYLAHLLYVAMIFLSNGSDCFMNYDIWFNLKSSTQTEVNQWSNNVLKRKILYALHL